MVRLHMRCVEMRRGPTGKDVFGPQYHHVAQLWCTLNILDEAARYPEALVHMVSRSVIRIDVANCMKFICYRRNVQTNQPAPCDTKQNR